MKGICTAQENRLIYRYDAEMLWIEPWGENSLRVRSTAMADMPVENDWALLPQATCKAEIKIEEDTASIVNGKMTCIINKYGFLKFVNSNSNTLIKELWQDRQDEENHMSLMLPGRELRPIPGGLYQVTARFKAYDNEKIFGMGQRQMPYLDIKGCDLELAQRNSQANIPFALSNRGYGFLWNNPAYGRATFAKNVTQWTAAVSKAMDYWIVAGDTPAEIVGAYTEVTGRVPMMPEFASGFWQCKLRYRTQDELLSVAREYKRRGLPISVIVVDFFHWPKKGDWCFDPDYWPDPAAMVKELKEMGIELMVSIWSTVEPRGMNYAEMKRKGFLTRNDRGVPAQMTGLSNEVFFDATNPEAREFIFEKVKENYLKYGIRVFWLDEAEPEFSSYDFDNIRYHIGPNLEVGNIYPVMYAKAFYDGMVREGITDVINLVRCAWAGSQRYGVAVWSGDIHSNFPTLRMQVCAGLNMGLSGIPWWTTDIGGFFGGDPKDPGFRELIVRWFQYGVFCPLFRLHGYRLPTGEGLGVDTGIFDFNICGPNEVWEFGEEAYEIITKLMFMRERLRPYIMKHMEKAHKDGDPVMRPLFYDFPSDYDAWCIEDQFMFGSDIMVAPVIFEGATRRRVYLPAGAKWTEVDTGEVHQGGKWIDCDAPLNVVPIFIKDGADVPIKS